MTMFCACPGTLSKVKFACVATGLGRTARSLAVLKLTQCIPIRTSTVPLSHKYRTSSELCTSLAFSSSRVQRAASLHTRYTSQGLVFQGVIDAGGIMSQMSGPQGNMCTSAEEEVDPRNCYHDEMVKLVENGGALIIEVRRADEIEATGMMNRACHIPMDELKKALGLPEEQLKEKYGLDQPNPDGSNVVFTCRSGRRSLIALEMAKEFGYTKARHYPGGWNSWVEKSNL